MKSAARKRILFVDDEPFVLEGLRRMLRPMRTEWDMYFAGSGDEALALLERETVDVVVSDMRMPGMSGAELLNEVMRRHPRTVRLVLSGHADREMILKTVNATHQFIAKPCEPELLRATIDRTCCSAARASDARVTQITNKLDRLPSLPQLYDQLVAKIRDPEASIEDVAAIVSRDPGMSAKILKLVNSAFFGLRRRIADLVEAVNYLGLDTLRALVLSVHAFSQYEGRDTGTIALQRVWDHSLRTAVGARAIAEAAEAPDAIRGSAFVGGMLHDIGRLLIADNFPDAYAEVCARAATAQATVLAAEREVMGFDHAEAGAALLSLWGLPDELVDVTAWHHQPSASGLAGFRPLTCVHLANAWTGFQLGDNVPTTTGVDAAYIAANDFAGALARWNTAYTAATSSTDAK